MPNPGVIINQCHFTLDNDIEIKDSLIEFAQSNAQDLSPHVAKTLLARLNSAHRRLRSLHRHEIKLVQKLSAQLDSNQKIWRVPRLHGEVHDLFALQKAGNMLFSQD